MHGCCVDKACTSETCMQLPEGKTCGHCFHAYRCNVLFGHKDTDTYCDWFPRRFREPYEEPKPTNVVSASIAFKQASGRLVRETKT